MSAVAAGKPYRTCKAKTTAGRPCGRAPIHGGMVCASHGGRAPQVREAAKRRMLELVDPALARLAELIQSSDHQVAVRACLGLLDRAGFGPSSTQLQVDVDQATVRYELPGIDLDQL